MPPKRIIVTHPLPQIVINVVITHNRFKEASSRAGSDWVQHCVAVFDHIPVSVDLRLEIAQNDVRSQVAAVEHGEEQGGQEGTHKEEHAAYACNQCTT